jgi:hypothetical protein
MLHGYGLFGNCKGDSVPEGTCIIADGKIVSVEETKRKKEREHEQRNILLDLASSEKRWFSNYSLIN